MYHLGFPEIEYMGNRRWLCPDYSNHNKMDNIQIERGREMKGFAPAASANDAL
jgi:hypothetical protein